MSVAFMCIHMEIIYNTYRHETGGLSTQSHDSRSHILAVLQQSDGSASYLALFRIWSGSDVFYSALFSNASHPKVCGELVN